MSIQPPSNPKELTSDTRRAIANELEKIVALELPEVVIAISRDVAQVVAATKPDVGLQIMEAVYDLFDDRRRYRPVRKRRDLLRTVNAAKRQGVLSSDVWEQLRALPGYLYRAKDLIQRIRGGLPIYGAPFDRVDKARKTIEDELTTLLVVEPPRIVIDLVEEIAMLCEVIGQEYGYPIMKAVRELASITSRASFRSRLEKAESKIKNAKRHSDIPRGVAEALYQHAKYLALAVQEAKKGEEAYVRNQPPAEPSNETAADVADMLAATLALNTDEAVQRNVRAIAKAVDDLAPQVAYRILEAIGVLIKDPENDRGLQIYRTLKSARRQGGISAATRKEVREYASQLEFGLLGIETFARQDPGQPDAADDSQDPVQPVDSSELVVWERTIEL